jgi:hypothetical protein
MLSENPGAVPLLEKYPDRIDWLQLARNPHAIHLLTQNLDKVPLTSLASNPNAVALLCVPDVQAHSPLLEELTEYVLDPERLSRFALQYNVPFHEYLHVFQSV